MSPDGKEDSVEIALQTEFVGFILEVYPVALHPKARIAFGMAGLLTCYGLCAFPVFQSSGSGMHSFGVTYSYGDSS